VTGQRITPGWLPVELRVHPQSPSISWIDFGKTPLSEPFFHQTVQRLRASPQHFDREQSDFEFVSTFAGRLASAEPCVFLFHISRCGSTLLANAFRSAASVAVVSEAQPITAVFAPYDCGRWPYARDSCAQHRDLLLRSMIKVFGQRRTGKEEQLVVKFTSWNILFLSLVRALWPTVPCFVLVRDPLEVMLSNLSRPGGWMTRKSVPSFCRDLFGWAGPEVESMTREEYGARVIGEFCRAATMALDSRCTVVDYKNIDASNLCGLVSQSGIPLTSFERDAIVSSAGAYSKDVVPSRPFPNIRNLNPFTATDAMREATERWATPHYDKLCCKAGNT
jgi:hypothetical protein